MSILINDQTLAADLLAQRRANGADIYDEVWDGSTLSSRLGQYWRQAKVDARRHQQFLSNNRNSFGSLAAAIQSTVRSTCDSSDRRR